MRLPLTIRILFHSLSSIWVAGILAVAAWIGLADATPQERQALGAQVGTQRPDGLIQMRVARAVVHFAPNRAAQMVSDASNGEISVELAELLLRDMAQGPQANVEVFETVTAPETAPNRRINGAKFVTVD